MDLLARRTVPSLQLLLSLLAANALLYSVVAHGKLATGCGTKHERDCGSRCIFLEIKSCRVHNLGRNLGVRSLAIKPGRFRPQVEATQVIRLVCLKSTVRTEVWRSGNTPAERTSHDCCAGWPIACVLAAQVRPAAPQLYSSQPKSIIGPTLPNPCVRSQKRTHKTQQCLNP